MSIPASVRHVLPQGAGATMLGLELLLLVAAVLAVNYYLLGGRSRTKKLLPPGPAGIPILGNVLQLGKHPWLPFTAWKEKYGKRKIGPSPVGV